MKYKVKPQRDICYIDGRNEENFFLVYEDSKEKDATLFSIFEREPKGYLRFVASFADYAEAKRWAKAMEGVKP
ncbi:MAG: hypothetical protein LBK13_02370 [Spirochaetales bacterium]|jgi:hypothetical protein|nr:hypothetical protein [Spirochaetales bacterium]